MLFLGEGVKLHTSVASRCKNQKNRVKKWGSRYREGDIGVRKSGLEDPGWKIRVGKLEPGNWGEGIRVGKLGLGN